MEELQKHLLQWTKLDKELKELNKKCSDIRRKKDSLQSKIYPRWTIYTRVSQMNNPQQMTNTYTKYVQLTLNVICDKNSSIQSSVSSSCSGNGSQKSQPLLITLKQQKFLWTMKLFTKI